MTYEVSEADLKTIRLNEQDAVSSVLPRATVKDVRFTRGGGGSGRLIAHVEIEIQGDG